MTVPKLMDLSPESLEETLRQLDDDASHFATRFMPDLDQLQQVLDALHEEGRKIVLTSGTFDIIHEGHSMYLEAARGFGDFLVVGVDSDEKVRQRKGPSRPAVPEFERVRMVTHQRGVGLVALKRPQHPRWELVRRVRPDVLVATRETYTAAEVEQLQQEHGTQVVVLDRMATISTSARLRQMQFDLAQQLTRDVEAHLPGLTATLLHKEREAATAQLTVDIERHLSELTADLLTKLQAEISQRLSLDIDASMPELRTELLRRLTAVSPDE